MKRVGSIALCFVLLFTSSCAGLFDKGPAYSTKAAVDIPTTPLKDKAVSAYVNQIAENLAKLESPDRIRHQKIDVNVLATARIQGRSYFYSSGIEITRGMLNALTNEAELAALIGHEIGHKVLHSKNSSFSPKNFSTRDIEYADWNQNREREADEYGAMLASKAGYDAYALLDFLERLSQFQKGGILAWLNETESTHKDFRNRAKDLRKFLSKSNLRPGQGVKKSSEYAKALSSLRLVSTNDAVNEILPGGPRAAVAKLAEIETEILSFKRTHAPMPVERFMEIMGEISQIAKLYGLEPTAVEYKKRGVSGPVISINFMKEVLSQDSPLWDSEILSKKIADILLLMSGIGTGFIPMVGDAVDLHEFLTGRDYFTQVELSFGERVLSAAGLLAGSGTGWRTIAEGIDKTLDDARLARRLGTDARSGARMALDRAEEVMESAGNIKRDGRAILGHYPEYIELANEMGARKFDMPMNVWNKMTDTEKWVANQKFLDRLIKRGDEVILATPVRNINDITGYFRRELDYLIQRGYQLNAEGTKLTIP